jgi:endonuclease YncB( thermonuclease family)
MRAFFSRIAPCVCRPSNAHAAAASPTSAPARPHHYNPPGVDSLNGPPTRSTAETQWPSSSDLMQRRKPPSMERYGLRLHLEPCRVIKVYDGDSLTVVWRGGSGSTPFVYANCRMYGIDTPEMNSKNAREKAAAGECKRVLSSAVLDEHLLVTTVGPTGLDKYGRPLINLFVDPQRTSPRCKRMFVKVERSAVPEYRSINDWALDTLPGCKPYFGGTKEPG